MKNNNKQFGAYLTGLTGRVVDLTKVVGETHHGIQGHWETRFEQTKPSSDPYVATGIKASAHLIGTHVDKWWHRWAKEWEQNPRKFKGKKWTKENGILYPDGVKDADFPEKCLSFCYVLNLTKKKVGGRFDPPSEAMYWDGKVQDIVIKQQFNALRKKFLPPKGMVSAVLLVSGSTWRPEVGVEAVKYLISKGIMVIATDVTLTFVPGMVHDLLQPGVIFVESLVNTMPVVDDEVVGLWVQPLKLVGREAAPANVYAIKGLR
ncbi:MAG: hypothetical protein WC955_02060 [Elusimicrobiota bacterium]